MEHIDLYHKHIASNISDISKINYFRQKVEGYLNGLRFPTDFVSDIAIIVTELGTNLIKHAEGRKHLLFRVLAGQSPDQFGVEIISANSGSAIPNIAFALKDGFSTTGTSGYGLGSVKRLSDDMTFFSRDAFGTIVIARKFIDKTPDLSSKEQLDWLCTPLEGYEISGDAVAVHQNDNETRILVVDGLGHGPEAGLASHKAVELFHRNPTLPVEELFIELDRSLKNTRGAAIGHVYIDASSFCHFTGIGNVGARIYSGSSSQGLISYPGIVGGNMKKIRTQQAILPQDSTLLVYSDGMRDLSCLREITPLARQTATVIASSLYTQLARDCDDSSLLVYKHISG